MRVTGLDLNRHFDDDRIVINIKRVDSSHVAQVLFRLFSLLSL